MKQEEMKILMVEDNPGDAMLVEKALREAGDADIKLIHENNLQSALRQMAEEEVDAILLDLGLPGTVGLETLEKVHQADSITPIIVLTGSDDEATAVNAIRLGAQDFLIKDHLDGGVLVKSLRYSVERNRFKLLQKLEPVSDDFTRSAETLSKLAPSRSVADRVPWNHPLAAHGAASEIDLADILENERVEAHFQPWVSLKKRSIVGFEGLCRGIEADSHKLISPLTLLKLAGRRKLLNALDRLFRKKVLEGFVPAARSNPDLVLSVNFDTSVLNDDEKVLDDFIDTVQEFGLDPSHIVIEILESKSRDLYRLKRFIETQRSLGFLIALDDIGAGYSNLERIAELKPDLIKTDRALLMGIDQSYHKHEIFKSMVKLSHSLGALLVAEGAETEEEAMRALELGADMIQGFYFSRPQRMEEGLLSSCEEKIDETMKKFKSDIILNINAKRTRYQECDRMMAGMVSHLSISTPRAFDAQLAHILQMNPKVECVFVLDEGGTQMSSMVSQENYTPRQNAFFKPSQRGADHSLKEYYYYLMASGATDYTFVSSPYLSLATGKLCVTVSTLFRDAYGHPHVLCVDMKPEVISG